MTQTKSAIAILALTASLGFLTGTSEAQKPTPTAAPNVPVEYQAAIGQMRVAKAYLEKAGDKWGGYRVKAIASVDQAFSALGVSPESTPNEMQSGNTDEPTMMNRGISSLNAAKADFGRAGNNWGGRKEKAIAFINQALQQLQQGVAWAKANKSY